MQNLGIVYATLARVSEKWMSRCIGDEGQVATVLVSVRVLQHHSSSGIYQRRSRWHRILNETTFEPYVRRSGRGRMDGQADRWTVEGVNVPFPSLQGRPEKSQRTVERRSVDEPVGTKRETEGRLKFR